MRFRVLVHPSQPPGRVSGAAGSRNSSGLPTRASPPGPALTSEARAGRGRPGGLPRRQCSSTSRWRLLSWHSMGSASWWCRPTREPGPSRALTLLCGSPVPWRASPCRTINLAVGRLRFGNGRPDEGLLRAHHEFPRTARLSIGTVTAPARPSSTTARTEVVDWAAKHSWFPAASRAGTEAISRPRLAPRTCRAATCAACSRPSRPGSHASGPGSASPRRINSSTRPFLSRPRSLRRTLFSCSSGCPILLSGPIRHYHSEDVIDTVPASGG